MWDRKTTYIIIPAFNEGAIIAETIQPILNKGYNIVIVDDASNDDTSNIIAGNSVHYLRHRINLGQGAAIQTGIDYALKQGASLFVTFDADGQHDTGDIEKMVTKLFNDNYDIIFGSRFLPGASVKVPPSRRLILQLGRMVNYIYSGIMLSDAHNGFRVFNRNAAERINLKENRMAHASEFLLQVKRNSLRYAEYPVHIKYTSYSRKKGQSLLNSIRIFFELVLNKLFDR